jgi:hypothetical protein
MEQVAVAHTGTSIDEAATRRLTTKPTSYPKRVRIASPFEEESVFEMCRELHAENGIFNLSENKVRGVLEKAFKRQGGILGVIGIPGKLEAMIYIQMSSMWYTDDPCLEELYTFVRPTHRKSRNAIELLHFAKWSSESSGLPLFIGVISNEQTERKVQLYQRQFGNGAGNFFLYGYKHACA